MYSQVGTVSYPTRTLSLGPYSSGNNTNSQSSGMSGGGGNVSNSAGASKQRVFTGTVTKVQDNFGFVDEEVFFQSR